jgi:hypothetical protein
MKRLFQSLTPDFDAARFLKLFRKRWVNTQSLLVLGISALFLTSLAWTPPATPLEDVPAGQAALQATEAPGETATADPNARPTRTPLPAEYLTNRNQTIGITLAAAMLVLIVVIGFLLYGMGRED